MSEERRGELEQLATALEQETEDWGPGFSYFRAAAALRRLAQSRAPTEPAEHTWLMVEDVERGEAVPPTRNKFNTMPDMAWKLLVEFQRQR